MHLILISKWSEFHGSSYVPTVKENLWELAEVVPSYTIQDIYEISCILYDIILYDMWYKM